MAEGSDARASAGERGGGGRAAAYVMSGRKSEYHDKTNTSENRAHDGPKTTTLTQRQKTLAWNDEHESPMLGGGGHRSETLSDELHTCLSQQLAQPDVTS